MAVSGKNYSRLIHGGFRKNHSRLSHGGFRKNHFRLSHGGFEARSASGGRLYPPEPGETSRTRRIIASESCPGMYPVLHLVAHYRVLIPVPVVGAGIVRICQKAGVFVLIHVDLTDVVAIFLIVCAKSAAVTFVLHKTLPGKKFFAFRSRLPSSSGQTRFLLSGLGFPGLPAKPDITFRLRFPHPSGHDLFYFPVTFSSAMRAWPVFTFRSRSLSPFRADCPCRPSQMPLNRIRRQHQVQYPLCEYCVPRGCNNPPR